MLVFVFFHYIWIYIYIYIKQLGNIKSTQISWTLRNHHTRKKFNFNCTRLLEICWWTIYCFTTQVETGSVLSAIKLPHTLCTFLFFYVNTNYLSTTKEGVIKLWETIWGCTLKYIRHCNRVWYDAVNLWQFWRINNQQ